MKSRELPGHCSCSYFIPQAFVWLDNRTTLSTAPTVILVFQPSTGRRGYFHPVDSHLALLLTASPQAYLCAFKGSCHHQTPVFILRLGLPSTTSCQYSATLRTAVMCLISCEMLVTSITGAWWGQHLGIYLLSTFSVPLWLRGWAETALAIVTTLLHTATLGGPSFPRIRSVTLSQPGSSLRFIRSFA